MIELREWISVIIFFVGLTGVYTLFTAAFEWSILFATVFCFALAYLIWPSKRKGQRDEGGWIADIFELLIELPVDVFSWIAKLFGRLLGGKGDGIDIDFDV
tara:strand:- start:21704 stop:22006 length:303 start_codon:yes stop_codon:yes gene_type:complete